MSCQRGQLSFGPVSCPRTQAGGRLHVFLKTHSWGPVVAGREGGAGVMGSQPFYLSDGALEVRATQRAHSIATTLKYTNLNKKIHGNFTISSLFLKYFFKNRVSVYMSLCVCVPISVGVPGVQKAVMSRLTGVLGGELRASEDVV